MIPTTLRPDIIRKSHEGPMGINKYIKGKVTECNFFIENQQSTQRAVVDNTTAAKPWKRTGANLCE